MSMEDQKVVAEASTTVLSSAAVSDEARAKGEDGDGDEEVGVETVDGEANV